LGTYSIPSETGLLISSGYDSHMSLAPDQLNSRTGLTYFGSIGPYLRS